jgi:hypothetical protein
MTIFERRVLYSMSPERCAHTQVNWPLICATACSVATTLRLIAFTYCRTKIPIGFRKIFDRLVFTYVGKNSKVGASVEDVVIADSRKKPGRINPLVRVWLERVIIPVVMREVFGDEN